MRYLLSVLLVVVSLPVFAADKYDPFVVPKKEFKQQFKTIALAPIDAAEYLEMPDSAKAIIEAEVTEHLQKRGYTVIPSSVLAGIRKRMEEQVGGFTDAETGETDLAKVQAVRAHAFRELWFKEQLDAVATIRVQVHQVPFENDRVEWAGVKQKVEHTGRGKYGGNIAVSSISFAVYDETDRMAYLNYGGLEVLQMRQDESLIPLEASQFFLDEKRILKATEIALKPI